MKIITNPNKKLWQNLANRPELNSNIISKKVSEIMFDVKKNKDMALRKYALQFDKVSLKKISHNITKSNFRSIDKNFKQAVLLARKNIEKFHKQQGYKSYTVKIAEGINCGRKVTAIEKVGLYIPGGEKPLISTLLMLAIPAQIAGCKEIVVCTPPSALNNLKIKNFSIISNELAYTCNELGIKNIYLSGGAQAIAALAYGTESIPNVYKIFGPGNQFVNEAKKQAASFGKVAIDLPAGPTELLIIADNAANPKFIAADLLSQAEHGIDSQVVLLASSKQLITEVLKEIRTQAALLNRQEVIKKALKFSRFIVFSNIATAIEFSNFYAPEHLIIATKNYKDIAREITNAGSIFLGNYAAESAGDYCSGTNHTLPTSGAAKFTGGVTVESFQKTISYQELSLNGIKTLSNSINSLALTEGLSAHANAANLRIIK